jgi:DNA-binding NtrC family response regulator
MMVEPGMVATTAGESTNVTVSELESCRLKFQLRVSSGPGAGRVARGTGPQLSVGSAPENDLVLDDPLISRRHLVVRWSDRGYWVRDAGSMNGTFIDGHAIQAALLRHGSELALGGTTLVFELLDEPMRDPPAAEDHWGPLFGDSMAMRRLFGLLPRIARSDASILIEGETGTGKSVLARAIHDASPRAAGPFVVVDCGSIPPTLIESVLFGHDRGAFTGAHVARAGAFESARGGTVFLDEIGELPLELQPKLLRALEARQVQRIGEVAPIDIDVRFIAATHRDLREMAHRGAYRSDLYYRLTVLTLTMPSLRERRGDIPGLVSHFYRELTGGAEPPAELLCALARMDWPGNIRELRNAVERSVVLDDAAPESPAPEPPDAASPVEIAQLGAPVRIDTDAFDPEIAFRDAKAEAIARWERWYIRELLRHTGGNLSAAARIAQSDRSHLRKLAQRYAPERALD